MKNPRKGKRMRREIPKVVVELKIPRADRMLNYLLRILQLSQNSVAAIYDPLNEQSQKWRGNFLNITTHAFSVNPL